MMSMLVETFIEHLIEKLKKRLTLYDKKHLKEYSDVNRKQKTRKRDTQYEKYEIR